jgi:hypothetical protein
MQLSRKAQALQPEPGLLLRMFVIFQLYVPLTA